MACMAAAVANHATTDLTTDTMALTTATTDLTTDTMALTTDTMALTTGPTMALPVPDLALLAWRAWMTWTWPTAA
jgi:hypothetical protein